MAQSSSQSDILAQLTMFGYEEKDIVQALTIVNDPENINDIVDAIETTKYMQLNVIIDHTENNNIEIQENQNVSLIDCEDEKTHQTKGYCINVDDALFGCLELKTLRNNLNKYYEQSASFNECNIVAILNDFLYLLQFSDKDDNFEYIYKYLDGYCSTNKCQIFRRNYRNRGNELESNIKNNLNNCKAPVTQIMDKIHCFYSHAYDICNKLCIKDKQEYKTCMTVNERLTIIKTILQSKRSHINFMNDKMNKRYHQLQYNDYNINSDHTYKNIYSLGFRFKYGYDDIQTFHDMLPDPIIVLPKYCSLKEELISNNISIITVDQFDNEYEKAQIHFTSNYCKKNFKSIFLDSILSLMVYCNYTELQYKFSKTYRENNGENYINKFYELNNIDIDHSNFYFLGKYITSTVKKFGTAIKDGTIKSFYRGINNQFVFRQYFVHWNHGLYIYTPLSTTSSFPVALNFATNRGLVLQFGAVHRTSYNAAKYFSTAWLSDFGNECECLFIQNNGVHEMLSIDNIVDVQNGYEFNRILIAIKIIREITKSITYDMKIPNIDSSMQSLIMGILHHLLSVSIPSYKAFIFLHQYAELVIEMTFKNKHRFSMDYMKMQEPNLYFLFDTFFQTQYEWIKLKEIKIMFPNVDSIKVRNIELSVLTFVDILEYLKIDTTIRAIRILSTNNTNSSCVKYAVCKYQKEFEKIGFMIKQYKSNYVEFNKINGVKKCEVCDNCC